MLLLKFQNDHESGSWQAAKKLCDRTVIARRWEARNRFRLAAERVPCASQTAAVFSFPKVVKYKMVFMVSIAAQTLALALQLLIAPCI